jgi:hypothetical protein
MLGVPAVASAAQTTGVTSNSCLTCHEDLYYLHDMGKHYCITEAKDRCVNCHEGDATVMNKDASHLDLIAYPQKDDGAKCEQCHTQDAQARLATFASLGGFKKVIEAHPYTPSIVVVRAFPDVPEENPFLGKLPWFVGTLVLFGLWLALVFLSPQKP